ncbi:hypothetical protein P3X46_010207, partial [Hevea brasiliensis]
MEPLELPNPLFIAIKDDSADSSKIACELAAFLKCPLINQNDITRILRTVDPSLPFLQTKLSQELAQNFEAVCQIALTQLSMKMRVIINATLSDPDRVDRLVQLASSWKAPLIIVSCETEDNMNDDSYNVERIHKLRVDI